MFLFVFFWILFARTFFFFYTGLLNPYCLPPPSPLRLSVLSASCCFGLLLLKDFLDARGFNFCFCFCLCLFFFVCFDFWGFFFFFSFLFTLCFDFAFCLPCFFYYAFCFLLWLFLFCFLLLLLFSVLFFAFSFTSYNIICARAHTQIICTHTTHIHTQNNVKHAPLPFTTFIGVDSASSSANVEQSQVPPLLTITLYSRDLDAGGAPGSWRHSSLRSPLI